VTDSSLPAGFQEDAASGILLPARTRRVVTPWADLNATDIPSDYPQVSPDLLQALAVLVAQGFEGAELLKTNAIGDLRVGARINAVTKLTAPLPALATAAMVQDTSGFITGDHVVLVSATTPSALCTDVVIKQVIDDRNMEFAATCGAFGFQPGDYVIGEQTVNIRQIYEGVQLKGLHVNVAISPSGTLDNNVMTTNTIYNHKRLAVDPVRSTDFNGVQVNISPGIATLTFGPFGAGFRAVIKDFTAALDNRSGAAFVTGLAIRDGASGVGTIKWFTSFQAAAGTVDRDTFNDVLFKGSDNGAVTVEFTGGGAGINLDLSASGYVEG